MSYLEFHGAIPWRESFSALFGERLARCTVLKMEHLSMGLGTVVSETPKIDAAALACCQLTSAPCFAMDTARIVSIQSKSGQMCPHPGQTRKCADLHSQLSLAF